MRRQIWTILKESSTCWSWTVTPPGPCLREHFTRSLSGLYLHNYMLGSEGKSSPHILRVSKLQQSMFYCVLKKKKAQIIQLALIFSVSPPLHYLSIYPSLSLSVCWQLIPLFLYCIPPSLSLFGWLILWVYKTHMAHTPFHIHPHAHLGFLKLRFLVRKSSVNVSGEWEMFWADHAT